MSVNLKSAPATHYLESGGDSSSNPSEPYFAIGLAAFNGSLWLDDQLDSILAQRGVRVQIFVSVDPSEDGTEELVAARAIRDTRVVKLPHSGSFQNAARNFYRLLCDINLDGFDFFALSDQDDIWLPDKLLRASVLIKQGEYSAYSSNVTAFWPDGRQQFIDKAQAMRQYDFLFEAAGPGSTYVFDVTLAQAMHQFVVSQRNEVDKVSLHDWFFYAFARSGGYRWLIDSRPSLLYRQHAANHLGVNTGLVAYKDRFKGIFSGWYRAEVLKITKLCCSQDNPFSRALNVGGWRSRLFVMRHIGQCRRRWFDRVILFLCCLLGLF